MSYPVQHHSLWYKGDTFIEIMTTDTMLIVRSNHPIFCDGYGCGANNSTRSPFDSPGLCAYPSPGTPIPPQAHPGLT